MITSRDNETVKQCVKLMKSAAYRKERSLFCAEGVRVCKDGVLSGFSPELFLYTKAAKDKFADDFALIEASSKKSEVVSNDVFSKIGDTKSPQGFFCVFNMLDKPRFPIRINKGECLLGCERIQDPSNLGTILRTAEALGMGGVILSADCCDAFSPKVVRGSMGAVFRMPMYTPEIMSEYIRSLSDSGIATYASTPRNAEDITKVSFDGGVMLIGNEGSGLSDETIAACTKKVMIPMRGRAESLNAAAAASLLMWEMLR